MKLFLDYLEELIKYRIINMKRKQNYIIFFDLTLNGSGHKFPENVHAIIEELRSNYFRNKSLCISDQTLLIVTEEDILDGYPNMSSWIEDIAISLSDNARFIIEDFREVEWYIFKPTERKMEELEKRFPEIKLYLNS